MSVKALLSKKPCWLAGPELPNISQYLPKQQPKRFHEMNRRERREYLRWLKKNDMWDADVIFYGVDMEEVKERGLIISNKKHHE